MSTRATMRIGVALAGAAMVGLAGTALADTLPSLSAPLPLPTLALQPAPEPSIWQGLHVGVEAIAVGGRHSGGGFGGDVFAGYDHEFANGIVLGVQGATGYTPALYRSFARGFDVAAADVKVGYDMGRLLPFVTAGVVLAKPHFGPGLDAPGAESLNGLFNGEGRTAAVTRVGAGVEYALTSNLTVGVAVQAVQGRGALLP